jgi:hypothetical protein
MTVNVEKAVEMKGMWYSLRAVVRTLRKYIDHIDRVKQSARLSKQELSPTGMLVTSPSSGQSLDWRNSSFVTNLASSLSLLSNSVSSTSLRCGAGVSFLPFFDFVFFKAEITPRRCCRLDETGSLNTIVL